jgi:uncharacterized protein (DUF427 family)
MKAIWNDQVIAEADQDELVFIERNWYFPPSSVRQEFLQKSDTPYTCPWKGECQYFDVVKDGAVSRDSAFSYPEPYPSAIQKVKKDFSGYVAFWRDVHVHDKLLLQCFRLFPDDFEQLPLRGSDFSVV